VVRALNGSSAAYPRRFERVTVRRALPADGASTVAVARTVSFLALRLYSRPATNPLATTEEGASPMRLDAISIGRNPPHEVNVVVEVPVGGEPIKYEMDKASGTLVVDRFLYTSMRYPGNYGFIPHTLSDDGDPCDVLIANQRGIVPGAVVAVRPVGVLRMKDEAGGDEKILAVPVSRLTRRYEKVLSYTDLPDITLKQIEHFFQHYKDLEATKWVEVLGWGDAAEAAALITTAIERAAQAAKSL
jgi:inorganic pyrophosphatase